MKKLVLVLIAVGCLLAVPCVASATTYTVDSTGDQEDETPGDEECETSVNTCTLRAAIEESNESTGTFDSIHFSAAFDGKLADTIELGKALPEIDDPVKIDGDSGGQCTTEAGPKGPCVGVSGPGGGFGLVVEEDEVTIEGLAVTGALIGINVRNESTEFSARDNWIGVKLDGTAGENSTGIFIDPGSDFALVGGTKAADRNVISNNGVGLDLEGASFALVAGNYFGVTPAGSAQAANGKDIEVTDSTAGGGYAAVENQIGAFIGEAGQETAACDEGCNVISGATGTGLDLQGNGAGQNEAPASGPTLVLGNFVGLDAAGTGVVENGTFDIFAGEADKVEVGSNTEGSGNYIDGGGYGIYTEKGEEFAALHNVIGYDASGAASTPPSSAGLFVFELGVVETAFVAANTIRMTGGIGIEHRFSGAVFLENAIEGGSIGIKTFASSEEGSVIAGNSIEGTSGPGLLIENENNLVAGNLIAETGEAAIRIDGLSGSGNTIGGNKASGENEILGSGGDAIEIVEDEDTENQILRNNGVGNSGLFIDLGADGEGNSEFGPNGGIQPPVISSAKLGGASGSGAEPGATVRVFRKASAEPGEIQSFLGAAEADGSGNWSVTYAAAVPGETRIAATQTGATGTSELTFATTEPAPKEEGEEKDTTPPQTKIVKGPKRKTHARKVKFKFTSSEAGSTFKCKLDRKKVKTCRSPKVYKKLKPGKHVFKVWAIDKAGNKDPTPAKRKFKVLR